MLAFVLLLVFMAISGYLLYLYLNLRSASEQQALKITRELDSKSQQNQAQAIRLEVENKNLFTQVKNLESKVQTLEQLNNNGGQQFSALYEKSQTLEQQLEQQKAEHKKELESQMENYKNQITIQAQEQLATYKEQIFKQAQEHYIKQAQEQFNKWRETTVTGVTEEQKAVAIREAATQLDNWKKEQEQSIRQNAIQKSQAITLGKVTEHFIPYLPDFEFNPKDARFLGSPIDFIVFNGMDKDEIINVVFIEVKTGSSGLTKRENQIKKAIDSGRVSWITLKANIKSKESKPESVSVS